MVIGALKALTDSSIINTAQGFGAPDVTTSAMKDAIKEWFAAYFRQPPAHGQDPCMRLAYTIVHKLDKGVFAEYKSDILDKEKTTKGAWMDANLTQLDLAKSDIMQWMLVGGEVYVKPVPRTKADGTTQFWPQVIRRNNVVILARDGDGRVTSIGSSEESRRSGKYYTLLEKRTVDAAGYLTIENKLFESSSDAALGTQVPLATLGQYAELPEWYTYPRPVYSLGLAVLRVPLVNCVDGSPDAVSVYEPAMQVIRNVDHMEHLHNKEFELGRHRIVAPGEMLRSGPNGERRLEDSVFEGIGPAYTNEQQRAGLTVFSPQLRQEAYEARTQEYLRIVENQIGLKRGLLSDAQEVEKTAFEIASTAGDYNLSLQDLQSVWFDGVRDYLRICDILGQMYRYCDQSAWAVEEQLAITWGNGVLYDPDKEWQQECELVRMGYLRPEIALGHRYDMPCETEEDWQKIREKYMPDANEPLNEVERLR